MAERCKRSQQVRYYVIPAAGFVDAGLAVATVEYTARVIDPVSLLGIAFTLADSGNPATGWHFAPGESYQEEHIGPLAGPIVLRIAAAVGARVELLVWET